MIHKHLLTTNYVPDTVPEIQGFKTVKRGREMREAIVPKSCGEQHEREVQTMTRHAQVGFICG